jgi:hypothetical protein
LTGGTDVQSSSGTGDSPARSEALEVARIDHAVIADGVAEPGAGTGLPIMKLLPLRDRVEAECPPCREYVEPYNSHRPHRSLDQHPPAGRTPPPSARPSARRRDRLGGLLHEYVHVACCDRVLGTDRFDLLPTEASAHRQVCKVTWNDDSGDRERYATLRSPQ